MVAAFAILLLGPSPWPGLPELALVLLLADVGHRGRSGRWSRALAVQTRARDLLVPLLALPLLGPAGDRGARAPARRCWPRAARARSRRAGWSILGLYDLVFGLLAYAIFDFLLEE